MDSIPKATVLSLCAQYGHLLDVPPGIKGSSIMAAIAANESSLGANCGPRHEPAFDRGGTYDQGEQAALLDLYGSDAACSYTPWQIMLVNCIGYSPTELRSDPTNGALAFVAHFNRQMMRFHPTTIEQIGQIWNHGSPTSQPSAGVIRYCTELQQHYEETNP